jgi:proline iminopeptidase
MRMLTITGLCLALLTAACAHAPEVPATEDAVAMVEAAEPAAETDPYIAGREIVTDMSRIVTPNGVDEMYEVTLGDTQQVINVRGADRDNPMILFVHGGPGSTEMPVAWMFQRHWEDYFTVVQWDQRGAGKSYPLNDLEALGPTLAPDRYRDDAIELIEFLKARYGKEKVILVGHSWGSVVSLSVAAKRPDLLYAYVGIGQVVDFVENEKVGYAWTLAQARADGNAEAIADLEGIAPYPGPEGIALEKTAIERKWSIHYGALAAGRSDAEYYFHAARLAPGFDLQDRKDMDAGSAFTMAHMWPQLASFNFNDLHKVDVPVFLFMGRHDYTTPPEIAANWIGKLDAPRKKLVYFEHSAHLPMVEEPGRVLVSLLELARPLAEESPAE